MHHLCWRWRMWLFGFKCHFSICGSWKWKNFNRFSFCHYCGDLSICWFYKWWIVCMRVCSHSGDNKHLSLADADIGTFPLSESLWHFFLQIGFYCTVIQQTAVLNLLHYCVTFYPAGLNQELREGRVQFMPLFTSQQDVCFYWLHFRVEQPCFDAEVMSFLVVVAVCCTENLLWEKEEQWTCTLHPFLSEP